MGVYINMEMPKKGEYKPLFIYDTGEVTMEIRGEEVQVATAIPVPPHGRLIDADVLDAYLKAAAFPADGEAKEAYIDARAEAKTMPTIIPAEDDTDFFTAGHLHLGYAEEGE